MLCSCETPANEAAEFHKRSQSRLAAVALVRIWIARSRERRQLAAMTMRELRDIRITRYDALTEAGKPFWRR